MDMNRSLLMKLKFPSLATSERSKCLHELMRILSLVPLNRDHIQVARSHCAVQLHEHAEKTYLTAACFLEAG